MKHFAIAALPMTVLAFLYASFVSSLWAASCCGGGSAFPGTITGDYRAQATLASSYSKVVGDAEDGTYYRRDPLTSDSSWSLQPSLAFRLSDYWQVGAFTNIVQRRLANERVVSATESSFGLGDTSLNLTYEFLPELTYSAWKPRGFVFAQFTAPTGPSLYDSTSTLRTDARSEGFYQVTLGANFIKTKQQWDFFASLQSSYRFARRFTSFTVSPGFKHAANLGAGYSLSAPAIRLGLAFAPVRTEKVETTFASETTESEARFVWNTTASLSYLWQEVWMFALNYTDQTLLGPAKNTTLERTLGIQMQRRWSL